ncbi:acyl-CoA thioesterase [Luteipulveratus halotolerans]|uniref:Acyl-CoA thioesterase 2 n=1 Tax=Luteipulveratus halotolerans TaxID=1631356 RepID=A0A0L6CFY3_9MICO|nr:acyl-CoA thioesterase II [Luteipulveratus halotolerans]KNX36712.1 acyl-CoA thioesterase [Luteipulveratus halotolerans]
MTSEQNPSQLDPVADLLETLDLQPAGQARIRVDSPAGDDAVDLGDNEADLFVGRSQPQPHGRVFGGQVLAQCVIAAGRTVADQPGDASRPIHSLHGYFLRAGDSNEPIRFAVERLRDGSSFSARRVHALQHGKVIMSMNLSFQVAADGLDHQASMPAAPPPERLPTAADEVGDIDHPMAQHWAYRRAVDIRHVEGPLYLAPGAQAAAEQKIWMRVTEQIPADPLLHAAVLAYSSDYTLLESVLRRHRLAWSDPRIRAASLDHAMWFHRPLRADDWLLYQQESPSASGGRGLGIGKIFAADGTLVATVAQEGMVRIKD